MKVTIEPAPALLGDFAGLDADRSSWIEGFANEMLRDDRVRGEVIDVGAGADGPMAGFKRVLEEAASLDGVDPDPGVANNPMLRRSWVGCLQDIPDIPAEAYDAALSFLVAEHIADPIVFLQAVQRLLKPGGVFYAVTPHANHPFPVIVRMIERLGLKAVFGKRLEAKVNDYPAYYRMNSRGAVTRQAGKLGFASAHFSYFPCVHWDHYFPRPLRFMPHLYDKAVGVKRLTASQLIMLRLEKAAG